MIESGYMYILECSNGSYYTGSTIALEKRIEQHQKGEGANHTKKYLPVVLVYQENYQRIDEAFYREKQVQGWSRKKKEALINGEYHSLPKLSKAFRDVTSGVSGCSVVSRASTTVMTKNIKPLPEVLGGIDSSGAVASSTSATDVTKNISSLPEVLEGIDRNGAVVSSASTTVMTKNIKSLPEALEGNDKRTNSEM